MIDSIDIWQLIVSYQRYLSPYKALEFYCKLYAVHTALLMVYILHFLICLCLSLSCSLSFKHLHFPPSETDSFISKVEYSTEGGKKTQPSASLLTSTASSSLALRVQMYPFLPLPLTRSVRLDFRCNLFGLFTLISLYTKPDTYAWVVRQWACELAMAAAVPWKSRSHLTWPIYNSVLLWKPGQLTIRDKPALDL